MHATHSTPHHPCSSRRPHRRGPHPPRTPATSRPSSPSTGSAAAGTPSWYVWILHCRFRFLDRHLSVSLSPFPPQNLNENTGPRRPVAPATKRARRRTAVTALPLSPRRRCHVSPLGRRRRGGGGGAGHGDAAPPPALAAPGQVISPHRVGRSCNPSIKHLGLEAVGVRPLVYYCPACPPIDHLKVANVISPTDANRRAPGDSPHQGAGRPAGTHPSGPSAPPPRVGRERGGGGRGGGGGTSKQKMEEKGAGRNEHERGPIFSHVNTRLLQNTLRRWRCVRKGGKGRGRCSAPTGGSSRSMRWMADGCLLIVKRMVLLLLMGHAHILSLSLSPLLHTLSLSLSLPLSLPLSLFCTHCVPSLFYTHKPTRPSACGAQRAAPPRGSRTRVSKSQHAFFFPWGKMLSTHTDLQSCSFRRRIDTNAIHAPTQRNRARPRSQRLRRHRPHLPVHQPPRRVCRRRH